MSEPRPNALSQAALQRLLDVSAGILGQLDLNRLLASIMAGAADLLDASQINLYRYLSETDLLEAWINLRSPEGAARLTLQRGEGLAGTVLATGRGHRVDDYDKWPGRSPQWPSGVTGPSMAVPLRRSDELLGIITVARPPGGPLFADPDLDLLQLFASQAAVAIANARLYADVGRRASELSKLYETSLDLVGDLDLSHVLQATLERATSLLGSDANLRLYDSEQDLLVPLLTLRQPEHVARHGLRPGEGLSGRVYLTGEPQIVNDYDRWEGRSSQYGPGTFAHSMAAPLRAGGKAIGVLAVDRHADELPFTDDDLRLLTLFANQASVAVTNAHLYEQAQHRSRELSHLYDTSLDITAKLDLNDVLEAVIRRTTELVEAQQGEVLVYDEERGLATSFLSLGLQEVGLPADIHVSGRPPAGLDGMVIDERRPVRVDDYDTWDGRLDSPPRGLIGPMIGVPILHQGRILGSLSLARGRAARPFSDEDEQRLVLFANQAAVAIANARQVEQLEEFHAQQIEKERLDQQLRTARAVQAGLLPAEIPVIPGWDIAAVWRPALQLGGDCYDVIPLAPERWGLLMADVSDKGIPAALLMAVTHSLFRVYASAELSPRETLARVNRDLVATSHSGMFVTAVYAVADTSTGEVRVAGAGHPPALVVRHPGRHVDAIRVGGMPLGIEEETAFDEETIHLHPGEEIVLYTDGVTEAGDDAGGLFGAARLEAALHLGAGASAGQRIAELEDAVRRFAGEVPASDDVACLVLRREPARDGEPGVDYGR